MDATFKVGGQIEDGTSPFADESAGEDLVFFALLGVFVEVHDRLADTRLL